MLHIVRRHSLTGEVQLPGLSERRVSNPDDVLDYLDEANSLRRTGELPSTYRRRRSHVQCLITTPTYRLERRQRALVALSRDDGPAVTPSPRAKLLCRAAVSSCCCAELLVR